MNDTTAGPGPEEGADVRELLAAERAICLELWTVLNHMRLRRELPAWVLENFPGIGMNSQAAERKRAADAVDDAIHGKPVAPRFDLASVVDVDVIELTDRRDGGRFVGTAAEVAARAGVAEQLTPRQLRRLAVGVARQAEA